MAVAYKKCDAVDTQLPRIVWNDEQHLLTIGRTTVSLTATEYRLLLPLKNNRAVSYTELAYKTYNRELDKRTRTMMDKHVDRIRGKLRGTGVYIYCVLGYGYFLLPETFAVNDL
jgi:DNA-binding response OmpR family regulator